MKGLQVFCCYAPIQFIDPNTPCFRFDYAYECTFTLINVPIMHCTSNARENEIDLKCNFMHWSNRTELTVMVCVYIRMLTKYAPVRGHLQCIAPISLPVYALISLSLSLPPTVFWFCIKARVCARICLLWSNRNILGTNLHFSMHKIVILRFKITKKIKSSASFPLANVFKVNHRPE